MFFSGVALLILTACGGGSPGQQILDFTFGTQGKVQTDFYSNHDDEARGVALQSDGKIVVAGFATMISERDFGLVRYNVDGSLDTGFGTSHTGKQVTDFGGSWDTAEAVVIQDDGKIVAAGYSNAGTSFDFALARYNTDGSLDTSFGPAGTGMVRTDISGGNEYAMDVALQADGKIVVVGRAETSPGNLDIALARYNDDGTLDTFFNFVVLCTGICNGKKVLDLGGNQDYANAVAIDGDGKILVAGYANDGESLAFMLARFNTNGSLDVAGFGGGTGVVLTNFYTGYLSMARAIALQPDGKILVAGEAGHAVTGKDFALARYHSDGSLDEAFNYQSPCVIGQPCSGQAMLDFSRRHDSVEDVVLQSDGKIVLIGVTDNSNDYDFALARYNSDGSLDTGFGGSGTGKHVPLFLPGEDDWAFGGAVQDDNKLVVVGYTTVNFSEDFAVLRYMP